MTNVAKCLSGVILAAASPLATATPIVMDFEGVADISSILDFYNGGTDAVGNTGGNYSVSFSFHAFALVDSDAGGNGPIANEPSPDTIMTWFDSPAAVMNVPAGFESGLSFFYSSSTPAGVRIHEGLDASGELIGTINLVAQHTADNCTGDPTGNFCNWDPAGLQFTGTAQSVEFFGTASTTAYDDLTIGSATPGRQSVPAPGSLLLLGLGLSGLALGRPRLRRR